ncbi:MAG: L-threonylcarbamoyladenylate synthase [Pseudomonadota bacterium]
MDMPKKVTADNWAIAVDEAVNALAAGNYVAIPTETVYGLAADATNGTAVAKIFELKNRPHFNPLICHVSDLDMAERYGLLNQTCRVLAEKFWPGPLTIVIPVNPSGGVHELVIAGLETIGLRCPSGISRRIIEGFGKPLAAPSANKSGRISPTTAQHVADEFHDQDLLIVDGGACEVGIESTIVKVEADRLVLLRPGAITAEEIQLVTGLAVEAASTDVIEAPGMMTSHYAPNAAMQLEVTKCPEDAGLLAFSNGIGKKRDGAMRVMNLSESGDLREAAANLYHHLKVLDGLEPELIAVEPIPFGGLGDAINDRLARAAAENDNA